MEKFSHCTALQQRNHMINWTTENPFAGLEAFWFIKLTIKLAPWMLKLYQGKHWEPIYRTTTTFAFGRSLRQTMRTILSFF